MKAMICILGLVLCQTAANAQSNELAMVSPTENYTPAINTMTTGPERLSYEISDHTGNNIAAGQLNRNSSMAVNVNMGTYTLRVNGVETQMTINNEGAANASAYIIVKMDKDGKFSFNKMLF